MDRRWEQQLRDKMSQYSQSEPEGLWEGIMQQMDLISSEKKDKRKKRNNVFIMACTTAAAAAIAAFFVLQENHIRSMPPKADIYALYDNNAENVLHVQDIPSPRRIAMEERTIKQSCDKITGPDTKNMSAPTEAPETETATVSPYPATADGNQKNAPSEIEEEYAPYVFPDTDVKREKRSRSRKRFSTSLSVSNLSGDSHSYGGFGTIQLKAGDNGEIESIAISVDGATTEYTTEKAETMGDDNKTNSLCRTWRVVKTHDKGYDPYEGDYDITFTPADDPESLAEIMFSKSGTFLQTYSDGDMEAFSWSWKDKGKGVIQAGGFVDGEGSFTVTFSDGKLYMHESYKAGDSWEEITVELEEKK